MMARMEAWVAARTSSALAPGRVAATWSATLSTMAASSGPISPSAETMSPLARRGQSDRFQDGPRAAWELSDGASPMAAKKAFQLGGTELGSEA